MRRSLWLLVLPLVLSFASPALATPPVLNPIGDRAGRPNELMSFVVRATDVDGGALALSASSLPAGATFTPVANGRAEFRWTPAANMLGNFPVTFTVVDSGTPPASDSEMITISIATNRAPVLLPIGNVRGDPGVELTVPVFAADADNDNLVLSASGVPDGAMFEDGGDGSGALMWLPGPEQIGIYTVTFMVTDDGDPVATDSEQITIQIGDVNRPPELNAIGDRVVTAGMPLVIHLAASDPDNHPLAFSVVGSPAGASLVDNGNGTAQWSWTPDQSVMLGLALDFTVTDAGVPPLSDSEQIVVTVEAANRPPMLGAIGNRTLHAGETLTIAITGSDLDGDALHFDASGLPAGASFDDLDNGTAELVWTPTADQVGSHPMRVTVTDDGTPALSAFEEFSVVVEPVVEEPPVSTLRIERARWNWFGARLRVRGDGAQGGETVSIVDAASGELLAITVADAEGDFRVNAGSFIAPCGVRARTLGSLTEPFAVGDAPRSCGRRLYTHVKRAEWMCRHGALALGITRLPPNGTVQVLDDKTGAVLGSAQANARGKLHSEVALSGSPVRVRLVLHLESAEWTLGRYDVKRARDACARNKRRSSADLEECR